MNALRCARRLLVTGLFPLIAAGGSAQQKPDSRGPASGQPQASSTAARDAHPVNLPVVVRDKKGTLLKNLTRDDLMLQVDGKPQVVRSLELDSDRPISLGLLVDSSLAQGKEIDDERAASKAFLDQMLSTAKDEAFVAQFSRQTELLQDLTSSRPLLQAALKEIDTPASGASASDTESGGRRHGGTTFYDALFLTSDEIMSKQTGRKVVVVLSDGVDNGSKETITEAIEAAQRADTVIYAIYFKGDTRPQNSANNQPRNRGGFPGGGYPGGGYPGGGYPGGGYPGGGYPGGGYPNGGNGGGNGGNTGGGTTRSNIDGRKVLQRMADETGGRLFEAKKNQDFARIYGEIAEELRAQYRLGFSPAQDGGTNGYHQVDLRAKQKDDFVQTRDGYYAGK